MKDTIAPLQFVTSDPDAARAACMAGVRWVQVRIKDCEIAEWINRAQIFTEIGREFGATIIVNDDPTIALKVGADGVHLGKTDMSPKDARALLGSDRIIGGTANTFEDIQRLAEAKVDYIGLGPLRFTQTKKELSPILGLLGIERLMTQVREAGIAIPIIVIGGVAPSDMEVLKDFGVHGVAVSSAIARAPDVKAAVKMFLGMENGL